MFHLYEKSHSSRRKKKIFKNQKKKQTGNLDQFLTYKQANLGPVFDSTDQKIYTLCMYRYRHIIYIYGYWPEILPQILLSNLFFPRKNLKKGPNIFDNCFEVFQGLLGTRALFLPAGESKIIKFPGVLQCLPIV